MEIAIVLVTVVAGMGAVFAASGSLSTRQTQDSVPTSPSLPGSMSNFEQGIEKRVAEIHRRAGTVDRAGVHPLFKECLTLLEASPATVCRLASRADRTKTALTVADCTAFVALLKQLESHTQPSPEAADLIAKLLSGTNLRFLRFLVGAQAVEKLKNV